MREIILTVSQEESGASALGFLKSHGFSKRIISQLKKTGGLTRSGAVLRSVDRVYAGDMVRVILEDGGGEEPNPDIPARLAYEDEDVVVFDKPPFIPVHPSIGHRRDTLANLFAALYGDAPFRPINRLDKNTSGLCVCARNRLAAAELNGRVSKVYYAVVDGDIERGGRLDFPIGRQDGSIIRRTVCAEGKPAVTLFEPVLRTGGRTLLRITLETGRTHQIRVHFSHIGFALCGDDLYGGDCSDIDRQALHCGEVSFVHPISGERITVSSELPQDMKRLLRRGEA